MKLSKHLFKVLDAWGIDLNLFRTSISPYNSNVEVYDEEEKVLYRATADMIARNGQMYHFKQRVDYRPQIFLPRKFWEKIPIVPIMPPAYKTVPEKPKTKNQPLF